MKITAKELKKGIEVDFPIDWTQHPPVQCTIKYRKDLDRFVFANIRTGEIYMMNETLEPIVNHTNHLYNLQDEAEED